jgi:uncharacterized membrane protein YfcA
MVRIIAILVALAALLLIVYLVFSKNQRPWNELTAQEQNKKKLLVAGGISVFLAGIITALLAGKKK